MQQQQYTYTGRRLEQALARVKRDLGADAIILSSRKRPENGADARFEVRAAPAGVSSARPSPRRDSPATERNLLHRLLIQSGIEDNLAQLLSTTSGASPRTLSDALKTLTDSLDSYVGFRDPEKHRFCRVVALVGPPGVGKTTTLAKIAARASLIQRQRVALITLDGYRVGAVEQIERFADLIQIPLLPASDVRSFHAALRRASDADLVLVDTEGRSRRDTAALAGLAEILHCSDEEVETMLCLNATTRSVELADVVSRYAVVQPTSLVMTKVDEAMTHDAVVGAHITSGLPLSYFTTGQRVPEDIEIATANRLAAYLCGEELD